MRTPSDRAGMTPQMRLLVVALTLLVLGLAASELLRIFVGPLSLALLLAYLSNPLFNWLEEHGIRRTQAVAVCLLATTLLVSLATWLLMPLVILQFQVFFQILPEALATLKSTWIPKLRSLIEQHVSRDFAGFPSDDLADILSLKDMSAGEVVLSGLGAGTQILWTVLLFLLATPAFSFFLMRDFRRLQSGFMGLVPMDLRHQVQAFAREVDGTVRAVLTGQILVIGLLSVAYSTAFFLVGLPGGLAIGILTGLARIVPYLDIVVGGSLSFLVLVTNGAPLAVVLGVVLSFVLIQLADGLFLTPRIVGQFAGLHPAVIVVAVLVFADRFGFFGVLLAIPVTAIARVAAGHLVRAYKNSRFYLAL